MAADHEGAVEPLDGRAVAGQLEDAKQPQQPEHAERPLSGPLSPWEVSARTSQSCPMVYAPRIELILGAETENAPAAWCGGAAVAGTAEAV